IGFKGKAMLLSQVVYGIFSKENITEEELEKIKQQDMINTMLDEMTESFSMLKTPLIDERDKYLAQKIKDAPGEKIVAVLGAAHVPGIKKEIHKEQDLKKLTKRPPKSKAPKVIGWAIPIVIIGLILATFYLNSDAGMQQVWSWLLWNGSLAGIGTIIALGHPLAVITAIVAAPFTSLNPFLNAGFFAGIVQAWTKKPVVRDFETLSDDVTTMKGFWKNKLTRVLLVFLFANIGSALGTFIAGTDIIRLFIKNLF